MSGRLVSWDRDSCGNFVLSANHGLGFGRIRIFEPAIRIATLVSTVDYSSEGSTVCALGLRKNVGAPVGCCDKRATEARESKDKIVHLCLVVFTVTV